MSWRLRFEFSQIDFLGKVLHSENCKSGLREHSRGIEFCTFEFHVLFKFVSQGGRTSLQYGVFSFLFKLFCCSSLFAKLFKLIPHLVQYKAVYADYCRYFLNSDGRDGRVSPSTGMKQSLFQKVNNIVHTYIPTKIIIGGKGRKLFLIKQISTDNICEEVKW